jgi:hypothetical protein
VTTDEFEGHLMAVLYGPNAEKIADRIVIVALANADVAKVLGDAVAQTICAATAGTDEAIFELAVFAHLSEVKPERADTIKWSKKRHKALQRVRARLAASVRKHPEAERIAEAFMLDLAVAVQPVGD